MSNANNSNDRTLSPAASIRPYTEEDIDFQCYLRRWINARIETLNNQVDAMPPSKARSAGEKLLAGQIKAGVRNSRRR